MLFTSLCYTDTVHNLIMRDCLQVAARFISPGGIIPPNQFLEEVFTVSIFLYTLPPRGLTGERYSVD